MLIRLLLVLIILLSISSIKERARGRKIREETQKTADRVKSCYQFGGDEKRKCLSFVIKERNNKITNKKYYFYNSKTKEPKVIDGELDENGFIIVDRSKNKDIVLSKGMCINTFLSLDFDSKKIYLPQDNNEAFSFCLDKGDSYILYPENMTPESVFVEIDKIIKYSKF